MLTAEIDRREFLKTTARGATALVLGFYLPGKASANAGSAPVVFKPNAWVRIAPDNQITIIVEKPEIGTGLRTSLPMLVAEELEADWSKIRVEEAPAIPDLYHNLGTGAAAEWKPVGCPCEKSAPRRGRCWLRPRRYNGGSRRAPAAPRTEQ